MTSRDLAPPWIPDLTKVLAHGGIKVKVFKLTQRETLTCLEGRARGKAGLYHMLPLIKGDDPLAA